MLTILIAVFALYDLSFVEKYIVTQYIIVILNKK